jgi:hypothetical protein
MLGAQLMVCAQGVIRDADTNQCTIVNVIESVVVPRLPFVLPSLCVFAVLERGVRDLPSFECSLRVRVNDKEVFGREIQVMFGTALRSRVILYLEELPLEEIGVMQVRIVHGPTTIGAWDVPILRSVQETS